MDMDYDSPQNDPIPVPGPSDEAMRGVHVGVPMDTPGGATMPMDTMGQAAFQPPPPVMMPQPTPVPNTTSIPPRRDNMKDLCVKVHIRRSGRDAWTYLGRAFVSQDFVGQSSRVVVRSAASGKIMTTFSELSDLHAEKRGNFVVLSCIEGSSVVSWSLNAFNNSETLKLLASIELACYRSEQATTDPKMHGKLRRRIERMVKEDRRRRHKRRREEEAMTDAFARSKI